MRFEGGVHLLGFVISRKGALAPGWRYGGGSRRRKQRQYGQDQGPAISPLTIPH